MAFTETDKTTTAAILVRHYTDLIDGGIPQETADILIVEAARKLGSTVVFVEDSADVTARDELKKLEDLITARNQARDQWRESKDRDSQFAFLHAEQAITEWLRGRGLSFP